MLHTTTYVLGAGRTEFACPIGKTASKARSLGCSLNSRSPAHFMAIVVHYTFTSSSVLHTEEEVFRREEEVFPEGEEARRCTCRE